MWLGNLCRAIRAIAQDPVNFCRIGSQPSDFFRDWREFRHRQIRQGGLKGPKSLTSIFCYDLFGCHIRQCGIDAHQIACLGPFAETVKRVW